MHYVERCEEDSDSWIEIDRMFDTDGQLHIAIMENIPGSEKAYREQCVHINRTKVLDLIRHLQEAVDRPNYDPYWGNI